jgi:chromate reductase, NAD(P)H dehydrogenase (quinone)
MPAAPSAFSTRAGLRAREIGPHETRKLSIGQSEMAPRILVFSGSTRPGSNNQKLAILAADAIRRHGGEATLISLDDYPLPFADARGWQGQPEEAKALWRLVEAHDGAFIASPEYNSGVAPLLKNALDWISMAAGRPPFRGKVVGLGIASGGVWGGYKSAGPMRFVLEVGLGAIVIPEMATIQGGLWNEDGSLKDEGARKLVDVAAQRLVDEAGMRRKRD